MAQSAEFPIFKCLRSCKNHLYRKRSNSNFALLQEGTDGGVNQRKNVFSIRFHSIGYSFMLLQPNALLFSTGTLKPPVYTLNNIMKRNSAARQFNLLMIKNNCICPQIL